MKRYKIISTADQGVYLKGEVIRYMNEEEYNLSFAYCQPEDVVRYGYNKVRIEELNPCKDCTSLNSSTTLKLLIMSSNELQQQISALKSVYDNIAGFNAQQGDIKEQDEALKLLRLASYAAVRSYINNNYTAASLEVKPAMDGCEQKAGGAPNGGF